MNQEQELLLITSIENGIQKIIINRPKKKNALTREMYLEITKILNESAKNESVNALVITSNGDFYSSGNDFISYFSSGSFDTDYESSIIEKFVDAIIIYPKLLIAIVNGPAIGIAATTLALFDIVYASETAYFLTPFCNLGVSPEGCSSYTFPRIMGPSKAGEMLYFGEKLSAIEAAQVGFISKVYKAGAEQEIWKHLGKLSSLSKQSLLATKRLLTRWNQNHLREINKHEIAVLKQMYESPDLAENIAKFMSRKSKM